MPYKHRGASSLFAEVFVNTPVDRSFTYRIPQGIHVEPGMRVTVNFSGRNMTAYVSRIHSDEPDGFEVKEITGVIDQEPLFDKRLIDLAAYVADSYISSRGEVFGKALPSGKSSKSRYKLPDSFEATLEDPQLTPEQEAVFNNILSSSMKAHLLFGITGSGKTEVYVKIARHMMNQGRSVIFLVPEIGISSQIFERLYRVFGDQLVLYHSQLTVNQRLNNWKKFYKGEAKIAVGTRSSVFMQCPDLGLIVVDEEQDSSYKEQSSPRYNARRIGFYRSMKEDALLILGSATPSIETLYAAERGGIVLHKLENRFGNSELPDIEILPVKGKGDEISSRLKIFTHKAVREGHQAVYLLNRRGFSPVIMCEDCGEVLECPDCSIGMNYHKDKGLLCHYCGYACEMPEACPKCGADSLIRIGSGTQRIEDIVQKEFPEYRIFRLDQDSARKKDKVYDLIGSMEKGEIDILLGTQMVSKGFDFHGITVAGIIMADIGLNMPDFRSGEKIFSLLVQLAGRSGRGEKRGKVLIQTLDENHYIYQFVKRQDFYGFYKSELEMRKALNYPPFSRLARLLVRGKDESAVEKSAEKLGEALRQNIESKSLNVDVLGPSEAPVLKVGGNFRYHIILKSSVLNHLTEVICESVPSAKNRSIYIEIDIDPVDML